MLSLMALTLMAALLFAIASIIVDRFSANPPPPSASRQEPPVP
jgi:hypothetical protein